MVLTLRREIQQFIEEQVQAGRFPNPEAVVEVAITEFSDATKQFELTSADVAAIEKAEAQADQWEGMELDEFRAKISQRDVLPGYPLQRIVLRGQARTN